MPDLALQGGREEGHALGGSEHDAVQGRHAPAPDRAGLHRQQVHLLGLPAERKHIPCQARDVFETLSTKH